MKRIWFKGECEQWIKDHVKSTTFRPQKHNGEYQSVKGSRYKAQPTGLKVRLTSGLYMSKRAVIAYHYNTEGPFTTPDGFEAWLKSVKLELPEWGWLHTIEVLSA